MNYTKENPKPMKLAELSNMAYKLASNYLVKYGRSECRLIINGVPCLITK